MDAGLSILDDYLAYLPLPLQHEVRDVFETLDLLPTRVLLVGTWDRWSAAPPETIEAFLRSARQSRFDNGVVRYEHHHLGDHHDHMICTKCGRILEFKEDRLEKYQIQIAASHGFHMLRHKMEIYGICADCLKERSRQMPLTMAKAGERLVIREISGGASVRMRLLAMGLRQGDRIEVITNDGQGQLAVAVDLKRYALGRGLAQKIVVESSER